MRSTTTSNRMDKMGIHPVDPIVFLCYGFLSPAKTLRAQRVSSRYKLLCRSAVFAPLRGISFLVAALPRWFLRVKILFLYRFFRLAEDSLPCPRPAILIIGCSSCESGSFGLPVRVRTQTGELALPKTDLFLHVSWVGRGACLPRFAWRRQVPAEPKKS
jgi:hypothetical protein